MRKMMIFVIFLMIQSFLFPQVKTKAPKVLDRESVKVFQAPEVIPYPNTYANYKPVEVMPNAFGTASAALNPAAYEPNTNTVMIVHRGATQAQGYYSDGSGEVWYSYSTDMGGTWTRSEISLNSSNSTVMARYPSAALGYNHGTQNDVMGVFAWNELNENPVQFHHVGFAADLSLNGVDLSGISNDGSPTATPLYNTEVVIWVHYDDNNTPYYFWVADNQDNADITLWKTTDYSDISTSVPPTWSSSNFSDVDYNALGGVSYDGISYLGVMAIFADGFVGDDSWGIGYSKTTDNGDTWSDWNTVNWSEIPATSGYNHFWDYLKENEYWNFQGDINVDKNGFVHLVTGLTYIQEGSSSEYGENAIVEFYETGSGWDAKIIVDNETLSDQTFTQFSGSGLHQMGYSTYIAMDEEREFMVAQWVTHTNSDSFYCDIYQSYRYIDSPDWSEPQNLTQTPNLNENNTHLAPMLAKVDDNHYKAFSFYAYPVGVNYGNYQFQSNEIMYPHMIYAAAVDYEVEREYGWAFNISCTDPADKAVGTLTLGAHPEATDSIDTELNENELPPLPPPGAFDFRALLPVESSPGSLFDLRNINETEITWNIKFQPETGYPLIFRWDPDDLPVGDFILTDAFTGELVNVNMKTDSVYTLEIESLNTLLIKYSATSENPDYLASVMLVDNLGNLEVVNFGLDSLATDGIDTHLGERLLPEPVPGEFDARMIVPGLNYETLADFRTGNLQFSGVKNYELKFEPLEQASSVLFYIDLPGLEGAATVYIKDVETSGTIINEVITKSNPEFVLDQLEYNHLNLEVHYNAPLPVELNGFQARIAGDEIKLDWETLTENNNLGFEIERKPADGQFAKIGYIQGNGTTTEKRNYSFTDVPPSQGRFNYRLKQIDFDGTFQYSESVEVEFLITEFALQQNFPNPFNPATVIKFSIPEDSKVVLEVFNILGEKISTLVNSNLQAGHHEVEFRMDDIFSSGVYIYRIEAGSYTLTKKMILLK